MSEQELDNIGYGSVTDPLTEAEKDFLDGKSIKVAEVNTDKKPTKYAKDGNILPKDPSGQQITRIQDIVRITSEQVKVPKDINNPNSELVPKFKVNGEPVVIEEEFNLGVNETTGQLYALTNAKSKTAKLFAKYKINDFRDIKGMSVKLLKTTNPETKKTKVVIAVG